MLSLGAYSVLRCYEPAHIVDISKTSGSGRCQSVGPPLRWPASGLGQLRLTTPRCTALLTAGVDVVLGHPPPQAGPADPQILRDPRHRGTRLAGQLNRSATELGCGAGINGLLPAAIIATDQGGVRGSGSGPPDANDCFWSEGRSPRLAPRAAGPAGEVGPKVFRSRLYYDQRPTAQRSPCWADGQAADGQAIGVQRNEDEAGVAP